MTLTVDGRALPGHRATGRARPLARMRHPASPTRTSRAGTPRSRQEGATYWIVDLGSTNGTEVNGRRVERAKLDDGDRITIGATDLVFGRSLAVTAPSTSSEALLALKIGFLVLLYLFIWLIVRSATRDLRTAPQESIILAPPRPQRAAGAHAPVAPARRPSDRARQPGARSRATTVEIDGADPTSAAAPRTAIRSTATTSSRAVTRRFDPRRTASGSRTSGSTNGTFVNGARVTSARLLAAGRRRPDRADRPAGGRVRIGRAASRHRHGPAAAAERGRVRLRAAALRGRGRDGRRAGGRARLAARGRRARGARAGAARRERRVAELVQRGERRGSTGARSRIPPPPGMGTTSTVALVDEAAGDDRDRPRRRLARLPPARRRARAADRRPLARRASSCAAAG